MAIDKNPRKFILYVSEIDASLLPWTDDDEVILVFCGKVMPSTQKRLKESIARAGIDMVEKKLM